MDSNQRILSNGSCERVADSSTAMLTESNSASIYSPRGMKRFFFVENPDGIVDAIAGLENLPDKFTQDDGSTSHIRLQCHYCRCILEHESGAQFVQCWTCNTLNSVRDNEIYGGRAMIVICGRCNARNIAGWGSVYVECWLCHTVCQVDYPPAGLRLRNDNLAVSHYIAATLSNNNSTNNCSQDNIHLNRINTSNNSCCNNNRSRNMYGTIRIASIIQRRIPWSNQQSNMNRQHQSTLSMFFSTNSRISSAALVDTSTSTSRPFCRAVDFFGKHRNTSSANSSLISAMSSSTSTQDSYALSSGTSSASGSSLVSVPNFSNSNHFTSHVCTSEENIRHVDGTNQSIVSNSCNCNNTITRNHPMRENGTDTIESYSINRSNRSPPPAASGSSNSFSYFTSDVAIPTGDIFRRPLHHTSNNGSSRRRRQIHLYRRNNSHSDNGTQYYTNDVDVDHLNNENSMDATSLVTHSTDSFHKIKVVARVVSVFKRIRSNTRGRVTTLYSHIANQNRSNTLIHNSNCTTSTTPVIERTRNDQN